MSSIMESLRKWFYKPRRDDTSHLAQFFYADEALNLVAAELDSFDGRKDPERCTTLVNHLRQCQDKVLTICNRIMDEMIPSERADRDFRVKFPDDVMQDNLAGQLWFGAECLAAGSSIMNREIESGAMRPLAKALTKSLETVRGLLREAALRTAPTCSPPLRGDAQSERLVESLKIFDRLLADFELAYVSAMVPVKSVQEYELQQCVVVLFSETLQRALEKGLLTQEMIDQYDPALMFTIPRLAIVAGLLIYPHGPLSLSSPQAMSDMFRPFRTLLMKIRELLWTLSDSELMTLEKMLCSSEEPVPPSEGQCFSNDERDRTNEALKLNGSEGEWTSEFGESVAVRRRVSENSSGEESTRTLVSEGGGVTMEGQSEDCGVEGSSESTPMRRAVIPHLLYLNQQQQGVISAASSVLLPSPTPPLPPPPLSTPSSSSSSERESPESPRDDSGFATVNSQSNSDNSFGSDKSPVEGSERSPPLLFQSVGVNASDTATMYRLPGGSSLNDNWTLQVIPCECSYSRCSPNCDCSRINQEEVRWSSSLREKKICNERLVSSGSGVDLLPCQNDVRGGRVDNDVNFMNNNFSKGVSEKNLSNLCDVNVVTSSAPSLRATTDWAESSEHRKGRYNENWKKLSDVNSSAPQDIRRGTLHSEGETSSFSSSCSSCQSTVSVISNSVSSDTSSYNSDCRDDIEVALAVKAAELTNNQEARSKFRSSEDLVHRLFVCISGVADQLQTNFAGDLRNILKAVFLIHASDRNECDLADDPNSGECCERGEDAVVWGERDVESPPAWVPDQAAPSCMSCQAPFTVVRRRHHCRNCGKVFCARCSSNSVPLPRYGHLKPVRVCNRCFIYQVTPFTIDQNIATAN